MPYKAVTERRLRFLEVDQTTFESLQRIKQLLDTEIDNLLDKFYAHILQEPELQSLFPDEETVARARQAQKRYWLRHLFAKKFDHAQLEQAEQIAKAHLRIGLGPSWYISGYGYLLNQFVELACLCHRNDTDKIPAVIQALNKLVFLDMNTVLDMYLEAKNATMRDLLLRATTFAEDMTALSKDLENAEQDLQAKVNSAAKSAEIAESVAQLSTRVGKLTSRLEMFQYGDRLLIVPHPRAKGFVARMRQFIDKSI